MGTKFFTRGHHCSSSNTIILEEIEHENGVQCKTKRRNTSTRLSSYCLRATPNSVCITDIALVTVISLLLHFSNRTPVFVNPDVSYSTWYCNQGFLARIFNNSQSCFCPFGFYGNRCQYQQERVTISFQLDTSDRYSDVPSVLKFVFYLRDQLTSEVVDFRDLIVVPSERRYSRSPITVHRRYFVPLLFTNQKKNHRHYIHIESYLITNSSLEFQAAWYYKVRFHFLPAERLAILLVLIDKSDSTGYCGTHGWLMPYVNLPGQSWCLCHSGWFGKRCDQSCISDSCSLNSICRGWPLSCLCPMNYIGPTCRVPTNHVCHENVCKNNGTCITVNGHSTRRESGFHCACLPQFVGSRCEKGAGRVTFKFDKVFMDHYLNVKVTAMLLRFLRVNYGYLHDMLEERRHYTYKHVDLGINRTVYFDRSMEGFDFSFIQLFTTPSRSYGDYYLVSSNNTPHATKGMTLINELPLDTLDVTVYFKNRISHIDQLFNANVLNMNDLDRVKFYQQPCRERPDLTGFHDEAFICLCNRKHLPDCFPFIHHIANCSATSNVCLNKGLCLQDDEVRNPLGFVCICERCFFGDLCQHTTSDYSLSLDSLLGTRLIRNELIYRQPVSIQLCLVFVTFFLLLGLCCNSATIILFVARAKLRTVDCTLFIMASSAFGLCSLVMLCVKFTSLLFLPQMQSSQMGCALTDYLLKLFPTACDWMNACVAIERLRLSRIGAGPNKTVNKKLEPKVFAR